MASVPTGTFLTAQYVKKKRTRLNTLSDAPTFNIEDASPPPQLPVTPAPNRGRFFSWGAQATPGASLLNVPGGDRTPSTPASINSSPASTPSTPVPSPIFKFFFSNTLNVPTNTVVTPTSPGLPDTFTPSPAATAKQQKPLTKAVSDSQRG